MRFGPLAAVYLVWLLWGLSWIAAAGWRGRAAERAARTRTWPPLAIAALGFAGLFAEPPTGVHALWRLPSPAGWAVAALAAAAAGFGWWARLHLGVLWSGGIVRREGHRVVDSGPYGIVRHPMYAALIAASVALAAIKATPLALGGAVLVAGGFAWKARVEERFLAETLGIRAYGDYRRRVGMLIARW